MDAQSPIYTKETECQDCYKCIRQCPVKAIKIKEGHAQVMPELCIMCGHCVEVCPVDAKKIRDDLGKVQQLLHQKDKVFVSLAPSFKNEFENINEQQLITTLQKLGFEGVSETSLGAQEVSANLAEMLQENENSKKISSACPTIVELLKKYNHELVDSITDVYSPLLAHCKLLRQKFGEDIGIVFIGPCIGKKKEADDNPELLDVAIDFQDLRTWLESQNIKLQKMETKDQEADFVLDKAQEGQLYPVDGGMIAGIKSNCEVNNPAFMNFSGIENIQDALEGLNRIPECESIFIELLGCEGGCINGPRMQDRSETVKKRLEIIKNTEYEEKKIPRKPLVDISNKYYPRKVESGNITVAQVNETLRKIGKMSPEDELNCSSCGYDSCRDFARAFIKGKAEKSMCINYMKQLANKKADALIRSMPSGVVIVDENLKIVDSNQKFAQIFGEETKRIFEVKPGMEGADLTKIVPFSDYFESVLESGEDILNENIEYRERVLHGSIFNVEKSRIVGGIFQDITEPAMQKEQVIQKTRKVIDKNLKTVQKIAYLLGENASETEVMLDSIIDSFKLDTVESNNE